MPPRNLLMILVDTLRADHLGVYGYGRNTSPHVDALARDAVRFERAYAAAPWTAPSVASMITGLYPTAHLVRTIASPASMGLHTLAEILRGRGFATAGVVSHVVIGGEMGFDQGFERYLQSEARGHDHVSSEAVSRQAAELLAELAGQERPFFLFVHFFDPHFNYRRHPEVGFAAERGGRLDGTQSITELRDRSGELTPAEIAFLRDLYDDEIGFTDAAIGRLLDALRERGLYDDTLILLTADHGEELLERGWLGHTRTLYEELLRVPLIIRDPASRDSPRVVSEPVSLVGTVPTLLELMGVGETGLRFHAPSFAAAVREDAWDGSVPVFAEVRFRGQLDPRKRAAKQALIGPRFKIIRDEDSGAVELYDLEEDPRERRDLSAARPDLAQRMLVVLDARARVAAESAVEPSERKLSDEEIDMLRGLGYIDR